MSSARRPRATLAVLLTALAAALPGLAAASAPTSLTDIEDQVMCVTCHVPLAVAESPQADAERGYIRSLIARGETKRQILGDLVAQYGDGVLALPRAHGFNLVIYVLPPLAVLLGVAGLAWSLPRWRRRARRARATPAYDPGAPAAPAGGSIALSPAQAERLDADLARFDG